MRVCVVGLGYCGLATAAGLCQIGHEVIGVDVDSEKVAALKRAEVMIHEPGVAAVLNEAGPSGRLRFSTDLTEALHAVQVCFLCVGTPSLPDGLADLRQVETAARAVGAAMNGELVVVNKSTVPVGTARRIRDLITQQTKERFAVISNPEFLREGQALNDVLHPERIVIGSSEEWAIKLLLRLYEPFNCPKFLMSPESAELAKYAANGFLAAKISFINEIAQICECVGANVLDVARVMGADSRIGPYFLEAGLGYGGSCFPKDTRALQGIAGQHHHDFSLLEAVIEVNARQRQRFARRVLEKLKASAGTRVAVWGLTFKAGTDDLRESAAVDVIKILAVAGLRIYAYDPTVKRPPPGPWWSDRVSVVAGPLEAVTEADALLLLTAWPEFHDIDFNEVKRRMKTPMIFDGRNFLADRQLEKFGFTYVGVGLGRVV